MRRVTIYGKMFDMDRDDFEFLKETLKNIGINVSERDGCFDFSWDYFEVVKKQKRNAGARKKSITNENGKLVKLSEVEALIEKLGAEKTALKLGIGRATLFRRLKQRRLDREDFEDDPYF